MIFFSSDPDFKKFYEKFSAQGLKISLLVTESPKKQGRKMQIKPNPAHSYALEKGLEVKTFEQLNKNALGEIKSRLDEDKLGFIFAYGKLIPEDIINLFSNGILNIHFSLLPEYPGASPIQQALLDNKQETGYTIFEITKHLDQGKILNQKKVSILPEDNFDSLRARIISLVAEELPTLIKKYLAWEIKLTEMPPLETKFTRRLGKKDGLISDRENAKTAYGKIRAFSRWPKAYLMLNNKRVIIHEARLIDDRLEILSLQPEGKTIMTFNEFKNGYRSLLTKMPKFVRIN